MATDPTSTQPYEFDLPYAQFAALWKKRPRTTVIRVPAEVLEGEQLWLCQAKTLGGRTLRRALGRVQTYDDATHTAVLLLTGWQTALPGRIR